MYETSGVGSVAAGGALAYTGTNSVWVAVTAAAAILAGFVLLSVASRRLGPRS
jgi:hypothetical protein